MSIEITPLGLEGVVEIVPKKHGDDRGFFSETFHTGKYKEHGIDIDWYQDNHSLSADTGVLRGMHFQCPPFAQDKLVRVIAGAVFDVVVDIRHGSPTFGKWVCVEISAEKWNQVFVPKGFAHGVYTLRPNTEVLYKVSAPYSAEHDRTIRFDDPDVAVEWPFVTDPLLSAKDRNAPLLRDTDTGFHY